ncbi:MAG: hypothetical protein ABIS67_08170 [Candidatus Eisenbacteria bacterium]
MLILTGVLGLVQALFLPGFVAARALGVRGGLRILTTSLALSLLLNFALVSLLVDLGVYRREALFTIFALECVLVWWVTVRSTATGEPRPAAPAPAALRLSPVEVLAAVAVIALGAWYMGRVVRAASGIFSGWDDVASWNRWAMDWFRGGFPEHTWNYPQIVPVAWSLTYAFMGNDLVQSFARGMMPLFGLAAMLAIADRSRGEARLGMLAAAWFAGMFLARVNNVTAGLADLPVAFFASLALAECLRPPDHPPPVGRGEPRPWAALFAAGAALAKQAGLYLALVVPVLAALREPRGRRLGAALRGYLLAVAIVTPWYLLKQGEIASGRETSEVGHVLTGAHGGLAPLERAAAGLSRLAEIAGGLPVLLVLFALGLLGLRDRAVRPLLLAVAFPFTLLWVFGFSYDPRNLSVALVAWAMGCGAGVVSLLRRVRGPAVTITLPGGAWRTRARNMALAGLAAAVIAGTFAVPDDRLLAHQRRLQRGLGDPELTSALFNLRDSGRLVGRVAAGEGVLIAYAPGWDSVFVVTRPGDPARLASDAARPDVRWLILPAGVSPPGALAESHREWKIETAPGNWVLWRRDSNSPPAHDE